MSVPLSQLVLESDLLVEDGAFELIDTSGMDNQPMTSSFQPVLEGADPLLLHASDDFIHATTSHFDDWLHNTVPLMSDDAVNDHRYLPSNSDFDRLVNANHDYYDKVPQMDLDVGQSEHSYAYFLPPHAAMAEQTTRTHIVDDVIERDTVVPSSSFSSATVSPAAATTVPGTTVSPEFPSGYAAEQLECQWESEEGEKCTWRGARCTVESHVSSTHVGRGVLKPVCRWNNCHKTFVRRYLLLRHVRCLHCDDKPFLCEECGERFALKERRKLHQRVSHGQHLQLKLPRGMQQVQQTDMQQLQPVHPVPSDPTMPQLQPMQQPQRSRLPLLDYPCDQCEETFPTTAHRRHHVERIHERILFACDHCWVRFADRSSLSRHQKRKHPMKRGTVSQITVID